MIALLKYLQGYIQVTTETKSLERFMNLCRMRNIYIWGIDNLDDKYTFYIRIEDFRKLKDILKKTKVKLSILKRIGLPFLMFKYRKHYSFVIGIILSIGMLYTMSLFVWDIGFEGNYIYTDNVLISYLEKNDITPGITVESLDCDKIESSIRRDFPDITWVSAQISGTRLIVHIKENDGDKLEIKDDTPSDIVSSKAGVVSKIITRNGTPMVKQGDTVEEGTVLVSGQVVIYNDAKEPVKSNLVRSEADVYVLTVNDYFDELPLKYQKKIYTGRTITKKTYNFWGKQIEFGISFKKFKEYEVVTQDTIMHLTDNFCIPIRIGEKVYREYYYSDEEYSVEEAQAILQERYDTFLKKMQQKGIQIVDSSVKIDVIEGKCVCSGQIRTDEPMTQRTPVTQVIEPKKDVESQ